MHSAFAEYFVKPGLIKPEYSRMLGNAFDVRLDSDYNVNASPDLSLSQDVLRDAQEFVEQVEAHLRSEGYMTPLKKLKRTAKTRRTPRKYKIK